MNSDKALEILQSFAISQEDKDYCARLVTHQTLEISKLKSIINSIHDGLYYGNWPWVIRDMNKVSGK